MAEAKLIIFDVDGVIYDIVSSVRETVRDGISKYSLQADLQSAMGQVAHSLEIMQSVPFPELILNSNELLDIPMLEGMTVLKKLKIGAHMYSTFRTHKASATIFPGVDTLIKSLHEKGIKLAILSNNNRQYVEEALSESGILDYFDWIIGFNDVKNPKPDPEGLYKILDKSGIDAADAIFIGDMTSDVLAGDNAGVRTIALASGLVSKSKLEKFEPFKVCDSIQELSATLLA